MADPIQTAVITTAGLGTRFLPVTRAVQKMLLPVINRPLIHYAVAEVAAAGIERAVLVTGPGDEAVVGYFSPNLVVERALAERGNDEELERLMDEKRIIRHWGKIKATRENAAAMVVVMDEFGSFGAYLADWPADDIMGLWVDMTNRFSQLGGNSGPYFLRMAGKDSFLLTGDVVRALIEAGVIAKKPNTKDAKAATAAAFNQWAAETGRPLCQISRILALSVG